MKRRRPRALSSTRPEWNAEIAASLERGAAAMAPAPVPGVPDTKYLCFYPMDRKRGEQVNWYTVPFAERQRMMHEHGMIGRRYGDLVKQIISGSIGYDDWEWGVDLFADDPVVFKKLIYEMRFDEVSAVYALFGQFFIGVRLPIAKLGGWLKEHWRRRGASIPHGDQEEHREDTPQRRLRLLRQRLRPSRSRLTIKPRSKSDNPQRGDLAPERIAAILKGLDEAYPNAVCALHHKSPWELLVATILSAQCTDVRVNMVTPELFKRLPTPAAMAKAWLPELEELIRTTGFFRNKAKSIKGAAETIADQFGGKVPRTLGELITVPGRGSQDCQRGVGRELWPGGGRRRRYPCLPHRPPALAR